MPQRPLAGRHVVTTRDRRGRLDALLARAGADVIHVPLIEIGPPADGGAAIDEALADLDAFDWVVVTSQHGAQRVGAALAAHPEVSCAAVGSTTAVELAALTGRAVDVVPSDQRAAGLLDAMPPGAGTVLVAQADRADDTVADGLRQLGYEVCAVTAYRTELRAPSAQEQRAALAADAVTFASGSAVRAWVAALGSVIPPICVAIGPSTAASARDAGLRITHEAAEHDVDGLVDATIAALAE